MQRQNTITRTPNNWFAYLTPAIGTNWRSRAHWTTIGSTVRNVLVISSENRVSQLEYFDDKCQQWELIVSDHIGVSIAYLHMSSNWGNLFLLSIRSRLERNWTKRCVWCLLLSHVGNAHYFWCSLNKFLFHDANLCCQFVLQDSRYSNCI